MSAIRLSRNARAAAAFCSTVQNACADNREIVVTDSFINSVTRDACTRYKGLNSLASLTWTEYLRLMCQAIAAQHTTALHVADFDCLARGYGILTDHAFRLRRLDALPENICQVPGTYDTDTETDLYVYTMDAAQAAMMLSMFDLGDRTPTKDGFVEAGMDYTVLCALIAYATTVPSWRSGLLVTTAAIHPALPSPWRPPFSVVQLLQAVVTPGPQSVAVKTLPHQVTVTTAAGDVEKNFGDSGLSSGCFWFNASHAHGPDGFCFIGDRVLLMQFKFLTTAAMTEWDVFAELRKMGMRTDDCIVAAWLAALQASKELLPLKKLSSEAAVKRFEELRIDPESGQAPRRRPTATGFGGNC